jgi:putative spermidine/putrescine transport system permease protein
MPRLSRPALLLVPLLGFMVLTYLVPFLGVAAWSVTLPEPGLTQYQTALTDPLVLSVFLRTFRICLIVTFATICASYMITLLWVRGSRMQRLVIELCILIPFWISVLTRAFGWLALLSNKGILNTWAQNLGFLTEPLTLVRNEFGVIVGMVHFLIPFAAFPLASAMRAVDERVLLAARGMGAGLCTGLRADDRPWHPGRGAGGFRLCAWFLRHPCASGWRSVGHGGRADLSSHLPKPELGSWRGNFGDSDGRGWWASGAFDAASPPGRCAMITRPGPLAICVAALVAVFLLMPLIAVIPVSFTPTRYLSMPDGEWSLRHYQALIDNPAWAKGLGLSIGIGVVSAVLATSLALAFSLGIWILQPRFAGLLLGIALLPMVAPPVVSALTLYFFLITLSKFNDFVAYDTWAGVALAHSVMIAPYAVVLITVALAQVDRRIDLAARGMGATLGRRIRQIILPSIRFGVLSALLLTFVLSWEEIGVTLFITSVDAVTLPRLMWMGLRDNIDPAIAAISVLLIGIVVIVILGKTLWLGSSEAKAK